LSDHILSVKGTGNGLLVSLGGGPWDVVEAALMDMIRTRQDFFRGAQIALQVGDRVLERDDIRKLKDRLAEHDVTLRSVLSESAETAREARRLDLEAGLEDGQRVPTHEPHDLPEIKPDEAGIAGVLIRHTLRNGRTVRHTGHVVVIGDVNPGAQIIAGGDVLVWGRLRGTVHAGALGDVGALVCALDLRPMQLRIASIVAVGADGGRSRPRPEIAFVRDGQIVAEEWLGQ
jgi:septum site-determining protein MinC